MRKSVHGASSLLADLLETRVPLASYFLALRRNSSMIKSPMLKPQYCDTREQCSRSPLFHSFRYQGQPRSKNIKWKIPAGNTA